MSYSVQKSFNFPYGHRLSKHKGLCKNIHGHNAKLDIKITSDELNENDMVIDFSDLKKIIGNQVNAFDHGFFVNSSDEKTRKAISEIQETNKIFHLKDCDPTSEVLTKWIYEMIDFMFKEMGYNKLRIEYVRLWESDGSMAEYRP